MGRYYTRSFLIIMIIFIILDAKICNCDIPIANTMLVYNISVPTTTERLHCGYCCTYISTVIVIRLHVNYKYVNKKLKKIYILYTSTYMHDTIFYRLYIYSNKHILYCTIQNNDSPIGTPNHCSLSILMLL